MLSSLNKRFVLRNGRQALVVSGLAGYVGGFGLGWGCCNTCCCSAGLDTVMFKYQNLIGNN